MTRPGAAEAGPTEGQVVAGDSLVARYASFVKLPHTLFALPFAGVGAVLASYAYPGAVRWDTVLWIVVAFTAARFAAMGFNRIADRELDAANPRTRARELPAGRLTTLQATAAVVVAAAVFIAAAWRLNPLCGMLAPVALAWILAYSYTKRFTSAAHLVLGVALGMAPVGAYLALAGAWPQPWYALVVLAAAVMCWVAGFDIIYALQDVDFDRRTGLHSIPARLGPAGALRTARLLHAAAPLLFLALWAGGWFGVGWLYAAGIAAMAALLLYQHAAVAGRAEALDLPTVDRAFFRANVGVSTTVFALTLLDRLVLA